MWGCPSCWETSKNFRRKRFTQMGPKAVWKDSTAESCSGSLVEDCWGLKKKGSWGKGKTSTQVLQHSFQAKRRKKGKVNWDPGEEPEARKIRERSHSRAGGKKGESLTSLKADQGLEEGKNPEVQVAAVGKRLPNAVNP